MGGGSGTVWVDRWQARFPSLRAPTPREFMESRPDVFTVIPQGGKSYSVSLANTRATGASQPRKCGISKNDGGACQAVREMTEQLRAQGGSGTVWIEDWHQRFPSLGKSIRE